MSNETPKPSAKDLWTEKEVLELFGVPKSTLARLRIRDRLPFIQVSRTSRLYLDADLINWASKRRRILNQAEDGT